MFVAPDTRNRKKLTFLRLSVSQMLNTDFGEADLILGQKFGQDRANGLWATTILSFTFLVVVLADAVFHDSLLRTYTLVNFLWFTARWEGWEG